jgi:hypothetical protein
MTPYFDSVSRRQFLLSGVAAPAILTGPSLVTAMGSSPAGSTPPTRFIFMHKGNGLLPETLMPPTLTEADRAREKSKSAFEVDLKSHELPNWMRALNEHKDHLTILQGLSGKMCTTGHHTWQSPLGVYKANERLSSIKWATVDFELARLFPSPFEHIELACFPNGGGNSRGNINGIDKGFSARGPQQPNYAFGSPKVAIRELFKSVASDARSKTEYELERNALAFMAQTEAERAAVLTGAERTKVQNYATAFEAIRDRNGKVDALGTLMRKFFPKLDAKYLADDLTTVDRQKGFVEILLASLITGMTNVIAFTVDELGTPYTGLPDLEKETVGLHDVGHGKAVGAFSADQVREKVRRQHMSLIHAIVNRLKSTPEQSGTMFDNTVLLYFPDNGETHHSIGTEFPFIILAGKNAKLNLGSKYIRLPYWGTPGCKTLGNLYTTILNAYGNPIKHYGDLDLSLKHMDQTGPIRRFLA